MSDWKEYKRELRSLRTDVHGCSLIYMVVTGTESQWDMDLMDMVDVVQKNDNYKYVLVDTDI